MKIQIVLKLKHIDKKLSFFRSDLKMAKYKHVSLNIQHIDKKLGFFQPDLKTAKYTQPPC